MVLGLLFVKGLSREQRSRHIIIQGLGATWISGLGFGGLCVQAFVRWGFGI